MSKSELDDEAFAEIYPMLRRFAAVLRTPDDDADDLVQEAVARALQTRRLREVDDLLAYLRAAVYRVALNRYRTRDRRPRAKCVRGG